jgi:hypothetical protein
MRKRTSLRKDIEKGPDTVQTMCKKTPNYSHDNWGDNFRRGFRQKILSIFEQRKKGINLQD